jgi:hypothetical protein
MTGELGQVQMGGRFLIGLQNLVSRTVSTSFFHHVRNPRSTCNQSLRSILAVARWLGAERLFSSLTIENRMGSFPMDMCEC